jgi:Tfp pilus assembly PilM family ATPase
VDKKESAGTSLRGRHPAGQHLGPAPYSAAADEAKDTAEAVEWEARRVLPFALEEAQMDWVSHNVTVTEEGEMQDILLVAVRDSIVERYAQQSRMQG